MRYEVYLATVNPTRMSVCVVCVDFNFALRRRKTVTAYLKSEQLLPFAFTVQNNWYIAQLALYCI